MRSWIGQTKSQSLEMVPSAFKPDECANYF